MTLAPS
jgi:hypothetical protein